jgi:hypothetical protein
LGDWIGSHSLSFSVNGPMVTDWTQGTPPQSFPGGIAFADVQAPSHFGGGSKGVCVTPGPLPGQIPAEAVTVVGNAHEPVG